MRIEECQIFLSKYLKFAVLTATLLIAASCGQSLESHLQRGEEFLNDRRFEEAEMQFRAAVDIDDSSAEAHWGLARAHEKQGEFLETVQELKTVAELAPDNLEAKSKLGNYFLLFSPPQALEAEKVLKDIFSRDENYIEGHILKASIWSAQGRSDSDVLAILDYAIGLDKARTESYLAKARFFMKLNRPAEAEEAIKKSISVNEKRALGYLEYARFLTFADRPDEAEDQFKKSAEAEPENLEVRESIASFYLTRRELEKAEQAYKDIIKVQENSPQSRMQLANFYGLITREDDALKVYEEILSDHSDYARARYKLAEIYLGRKDLDRVKAEVEKLLSINDTDAEALMLSARVKLQENKADQAIQDLEEVLKKQPTLQTALFYMTQARLELGQTDQARAFIGDLERFHPKYHRIGLLKIQAAFIGNEPESALQESNKLIRRVSKAFAGDAYNQQELEELRVRGITARGLANLQLGKIDDAEEDLLEVARLSPNSASAKINLARLFSAKRDFDAALEHYEGALSIDPKNFDALTGAVTVLSTQKEFESAKTKIDKAIAGLGEDKATLPALHYLKSDVYIAERKLDAAEAELKKSIELDEEYLPAYSAYASLLFSKNQTDEALAQYRKVVAKKPSASVYTLIGMIEDGRQNYDEAEKLYRKALEISPGTPIAANNLAWMIADLGRGNLDEALRLAQDTADKNKKVAGFYDTLGWVKYKRKFYSRAVESLKKAVALEEAQARREGRAPNPGYRLRLG
ncbi:MAG: tetratricopeptide repeat protein, partial [Pyrinomonadaceae bacterium]|nr:tetratricopeptide repeat protein [Pyrinomonadaceae bacterium]